MKEPQSTDLKEQTSSRDATALEAIMELLLPLPRESKQRILDTVAVFFSIQVRDLFP